MFTPNYNYNPNNAFMPWQLANYIPGNFVPLNKEEIANITHIRPNIADVKRALENSFVYSNTKHIAVENHTVFFDRHDYKKIPILNFEIVNCILVRDEQEGKNFYVINVITQDGDIVLCYMDVQDLTSNKIIRFMTQNGLTYNNYFKKEEVFKYFSIHLEDMVSNPSKPVIIEKKAGFVYNETTDSYDFIAASSYQHLFSPAVHQARLLPVPENTYNAIKMLHTYIVSNFKNQYNIYFLLLIRYSGLLNTIYKSVGADIYNVLTINCIADNVQEDVIIKLLTIWNDGPLYNPTFLSSPLHTIKKIVSSHKDCISIFRTDDVHSSNEKHIHEFYYGKQLFTIQKSSCLHSADSVAVILSKDICLVEFDGILTLNKINAGMRTNINTNELVKILRCVDSLIIHSIIDNKEYVSDIENKYKRLKKVCFSYAIPDSTINYISSLLVTAEVINEIFTVYNYDFFSHFTDNIKTFKLEFFKIAHEISGDNSYLNLSEILRDTLINESYSGFLSVYPNYSEVITNEPKEAVAFVNEKFLFISHENLELIVRKCKINGVLTCHVIKSLDAAGALSRDNKTYTKKSIIFNNNGVGVVQRMYCIHNSFFEQMGSGSYKIEDRKKGE